MTKITTIIPTYNQQDYIDAAVGSAIKQTGEFSHEILISSDGSTDNTHTKIKKWQKNWPLLVRDISEDFNVGISGNFRRLFEVASGEYIAILEGDDLWTDPTKLEKQRNFLWSNPDCSMVFSMIKVRQLPSGQDTFLDRQKVLTKNKLRGEDFLADPSMNLIANFSSCMLKSSIVRQLPDRMFRERFNEIAMAFFFESFGPIGFIKEEMSIYHQHAEGVWSGISREGALRSGIETRQMALDVADARHAASIRQIIEERYQKPLANLSNSP